MDLKSVKGTVKVISSDSPFEEYKRFWLKRVPFKPLTNQGSKNHPHLSTETLVMVRYNRYI